MTRIDATFATLKKQNRAAFIPFIMAGDPDIKKSASLLDALPKAGADIIELGIPFSDPMADGPVIQAAGLRALKAKTTVKQVLGLAAQFRKTHDTPLVLMGYLNPIANYGYKKFAADAAKAGVDGVILVDLPPEEASAVEPYLKAKHIALIRLIAPTSIDNRIKTLVKSAQGYLYYISVTGVTGASLPTGRHPREGGDPGQAIRTQHGMDSRLRGNDAVARSSQNYDIATSLKQIRKHTKLPIAVGFGVKTPADVKALAKLADGVIVGSALVRMIHESKADVKKVSAFVASLANSCVK
jgi:tryptophan synthase alpha chain